MIFYLEKNFCDTKSDDQKEKKFKKEEKKNTTEKKEKVNEETKEDNKLKQENKNKSEERQISEEKKTNPEQKVAENNKKPEEKQNKDNKKSEDKKTIEKSSQNKEFKIDKMKYIKLVENLKKDPAKLTEQNFISQQKNIESALFPNQKLFVDRVARYFASMNICQIEEGMKMINPEYKTYLLPQITINQDLPLSEDLGDIKNPNKKDFNEEKEILINLSKWYMEANPSFGFGAGGAAPVAAKKEEKADKKESKDQKVEKEIYDLELTSFDAAKKIGLIKEVRTLTNLGLKEAKELVEKAPTILLKSIKKKDTEEIVKKLKEAGATITLK